MQIQTKSACRNPIDNRVILNQEDLSIGAAILRKLGNLENFMMDTESRTENVMSNMLLIEYVRYWLENVKKRKLKPSSLDRYMTEADTLEKYSIAQIKIKDIVADDITNYLYEVAQEYAYSTVKKQKTIVVAPLQHALGNKYISVDVTKGVYLPKQEDCKVERRVIKDFSPEEQAKLWDVIEHFESYIDYVIGFQLETGARVNEALALTWDDIDFSKPLVRIRKTVTRLGHEGKTFISDSPKSFSSIRNIPLRPRAVELLKRLQATAPNEWVFSNEDGKRISYDSVRSRMKTICKIAGVPYQPPHATRHTFTTNLFDSQADAKVIQKLLGHSDENLAKNTYRHLHGDGFEQMYEGIMQIR